ncbi:MAG TPA: hemin ABC transporter ATP-binding protein, partial [Corynebacterium variabile]|nr:hemin ABC transporter ATP-binding protein [Corynebacterium variabile]
VSEVDGQLWIRPTPGAGLPVGQPDNQPFD